MFKLIFLVSLFYQINCTIYDVIIIGGGVSGLAASAQLMQNNITNILVLEGNNRLGGRVNTVKYGDALIEIGAQWVHGSEGNPIFNILNSIDQIDNQTDFFRDGTFYAAYGNGAQQSETKVDYIDEQIQNLLDDLLEALPSGTTTKTSLGYLIDKEWKELTSTTLKNYDKQLLSTVLKSKLDDMRSDYACTSFYELSAVGYDNYADFGGEEFNNLKNGYIKLIEYLSSKSPNKFALNELVTRIDWSGAVSRISTINSKTKMKSTYEAKYVISTVSLGVLKANYKTLFYPSLPSAKISAINRVGFGTVNKFFIVYDKSLFEDGEVGFRLLWNSNIKFSLSMDKRCNLKGSTFYKSFNSFFLVPKKSNILFAFLVGADGAFSETVSDQCMIDIIYELFMKFFPKLNIPKAKTILRSKWTTNPLYRGSYSFVKVGSTIQDYDTLAKPVNNKLFFAGEATSHYIGTVHGAYLSGISAADSIDNLL